MAGPIIYNIFPRYYSDISQWIKRLYDIKEMNFNWVYLNPFHYTGFSGSLYSVKDYYLVNPCFLEEIDSYKYPVQDNIREIGYKKIRDFIKVAHKKNLRVIMDLVINHTAIDAVYTQEHPEWYKKDNNGNIKKPGCWDNGQWLEWGDLAELNTSYDDRDNKNGLWNFWAKLIDFYVNSIGFDGFRCDAAYQVSSELWDFLITGIKNKKSDIKFFGETLGCQLEEIKPLLKAGFDYTFNSAKYWNYKDDWLPKQYAELFHITKSIAFPESHDTERLIKTVNYNIKEFFQRYIFTHFFSSGIMITDGFEYLYDKKPNVVSTNNSDKPMPIFFTEGPKVNNRKGFNIKKIISYLNEIKLRYDIFSNEVETEFLEKNNILYIIKRQNKNIALILLNIIDDNLMIDIEILKERGIDMEILKELELVFFERDKHSISGKGIRIFYS